MYLVSKKWIKRYKGYLGLKPRFALYDQQPPIVKGAEPPGPMSNEDILESPDKYLQSDDPTDIYNMVLKYDMRDHYDFKILNEQRWKYLYERYGGVPIKREQYVETYSSYSSYVYQEVTPLKLNLALLPIRDDFDTAKIVEEKPLYISKRNSLTALKARIAKVFNHYYKGGLPFDSGRFRLWKLDDRTLPAGLMTKLQAQTPTIKTAQIKNVDGPLEENAGIDFPGLALEMLGEEKPLDVAGVYEYDRLYLEQANARGEFIFRYRKNVQIRKCDYCFKVRPILVICRCNEAFYCSELCKQNNERYHEDKCTAVDLDEDLTQYKEQPQSSMGLVGLQNIGNTCFMNSGLQCLSNTWLLARYFLEDRYNGEINATNKLGAQGQVARAFAKLMKVMWYDTATTFSPSGFKRAIAKFHSSFSGYAQQDAQELIVTTLEALHEDLNRVVVKPYVEMASTDDPQNDLISIESYDKHLARNQSIVVDLMYGQYKSIVYCPICPRYSVSFEPFCMISLPIPKEKHMHITLYFVPYGLNRKTLKCSLMIEKKTTVEALRTKLATLLGVHKDSMMLTMVSGNSFDRFLCRDKPSKLIVRLQEKQASYLYVQEIDPAYFRGPLNLTVERRRAEVEQKKEQEAKARESANQQQRQGNQDKLLEDEKNANNLASGRHVVSYSTNTGQGDQNNWGSVNSSSSTYSTSSNYSTTTSAWTGTGYTTTYSAPAQKKDKTPNHDDNNNGLDDEVLHVCLSVYRRVKTTYYSGYIKERKTFNRLVYVKRSDTLRDVHMAVFHYFRPLFDDALRSSSQGRAAASYDPKLEKEKDTEKDKEKEKEKEKERERMVTEESKGLSETELFERFFPDLTETNWESKLRSPTNYPYELRFVNVADKSYWNRQKCFYCNLDYCDNCVVPFTSTLRVKDMLAKINDKDLVKNDYFYYEHAYNGEGKKDFELELIFDEDPQICRVNVGLLDEIELHPHYAPATAANSGLPLAECMKQYQLPEVLDENNTWYCNKCKNNVKATKQIQLFHCPPILILHLKRFKMNQNAPAPVYASTTSTVSAPVTGSRVNTLISFPLENLDLSPYVKKFDIPPVYDLYAVANHSGTLGYGHYTAVAKNKKTNLWYEFNDSIVTKIDPDKVCTSSAYVLFYKRKDITDDVDFAKLKQVPTHQYGIFPRAAPTPTPTPAPTPAPAPAASNPQAQAGPSTSMSSQSDPKEEHRDGEKEKEKEKMKDNEKVKEKEKALDKMDDY